MGLPVAVARPGEARRVVHVLAPGDMGDSTQRVTVALPDRYEIVHVHGRGGMATVFLAVDRKHDRQVALKLLAPELAAGIGAERFLREIQFAAHLSHPHIVPLLDSGLADGRPYYVMPFVEGESLRERLTREGSLPLDEALRIARDVAEALGYAHDRGVVHRDIKPGNILLTAGSAVVTDFGIAAAMDEAAERHLTRPGLSVGTPGYMSPEQACGDEDLDGRTDQYGLAAVLFEMLVGDPPYAGRNARAILGRQISQPVPDVCALREGVPAEVGELLRRALSRTPDERHPTTRAFATAIEEAAHRAAVGAGPVRFRTRPAVWATLGVTVVLGAAAWLIPDVGAQRAEDEAPPSPGDPFTYAVFPFMSSLGDSLAIGEDLLLQDALVRWDGIHVIQAFQLRNRMDRTGAENLTVEQAGDVSLSLGAGRFIVGRLDWRGEAIRVEAALHEAVDGGHERIQTAIALLDPDLSGADSTFAELADILLYRGDPPDVDRPDVAGSSYPAHLAYQVGYRALEEWNLVAADSAFTRATQLDGDFARAHLWTALVRAWSGSVSSTWRPYAEQAVLHGGGLSSDEAMMAAAVAAQADGNFAEACPSWRELTRAHDGDFTAWYGLAVCLHMDPRVVRDEASPSGWSFASSYEEAQAAYRKAFDRLPAILESFGSDSYRSMRRLLLVSPHRLRGGRAEDTEGSTFLAYQAWRGDTLSYVPWPVDVAFSRRARPAALERAAAVEHQRRVFLDVARSWAAVSRTSSHAKEVLAIGLLMNGHASALDTLIVGRALASSSEERRSLAGTEVWMRLLLGLPGDSSSLRRARVLADSLLETATVGVDPERTAALATLLGRSATAAAHARAIPADARLALSPIGQAQARALLVFAALTGPADSLARLDRQVAEGVQRILPVERRDVEREQWLTLPVTLAFPEIRLPSAADLDDWLVSAQGAALEADTSGAMALLAESREGRRGIPGYARTLDALMSEASLLMALERPDVAADVVDPTLAELPLIDIDQIARPEQAASLVRLAALRAEISRATGEREAARTWARAVAILWSDADPFLQDLVEQMRQLAVCRSC